MAPYGLGAGLTVRLGTLLATSSSVTTTNKETSSSSSPIENHQEQQQRRRQTKNDSYDNDDDDSVCRARRVALTTLGVAALVGFTEAFVLYQCEQKVFRLFTSDPEVMHAMKSIWFMVCAYIFVMHMYAIHEAILRGEFLGMKKKEANMHVARTI